MKMTINTDYAAQLLSEKDYGFTYSGAYALAEYLEEIDPDMEFDAVAIQCDFSQFESSLEAAENYGFDFDDGDVSDEDKEELAKEWLHDRTILIEFDGGVIIQAF